MTPSTSSPKIICPVCKETGFSVSEKGLVLKKTVYRCNSCETEMETRGGQSFLITSVGGGYSNAKSIVVGKKLKLENLGEPGFHAFSDQELEDISDARSSLLDNVINEAAEKFSGDFPVLLKEGENPVMRMGRVRFCEERSKGGDNVLATLDTGDLLLTTKRYAFVGVKRSVAQPLSRITSIQVYNDGIGVSRSNKQKVEYFLGDYHWPLMAAIIKGTAKKAGT
jgi:hypothetical protein